MSLYTELADLVVAAGRDLGTTIDGEAVQEVIKAQGRLLAKAINEPGYRKALISARNTVALAAGIDAVNAADAIDTKILGVIEGGMGIIAKILGGLV